jgi:hypothetical protein
MKGSADISDRSSTLMRDYAGLCGRALARVHARSGERIAVAAYLGRSDTFDRAMADFAMAYADRTVVDHAALEVAIASGAIDVIKGV